MEYNSADDGETGSKLELIDVRDLDDEERKQLLAEVPKAWKKIITDSGCLEHCIQVQYVRQEATSRWQKLGFATNCWQKPDFAIGLGLGTILGGAFMSVLVYYLCDRRHDNLLSPTNSATDSCNTTLHSSTPSENTPSWSEAVTRILSDTMFNAAGNGTPPDTRTPRIAIEATCKPRWNVNDVTTLISKTELADLRVPPDVCQEKYENLRSAKGTNMVPATLEGWSKLTWDRYEMEDCLYYGGSIVCADDISEEPTCHFYGFPFKFDSQTVWEAVIHYLKPPHSQCGYRCNTCEFGRALYAVRVAEEVGRSIPGVDLEHASEDQKRQLGFEIDKYLVNNDNCSYVTSGDACIPHVARPDCDCIKASFSSTFHNPSDQWVRWGQQIDFNTNEEILAQYYTAYKRTGYRPYACVFDCHSAASSMGAEILKYWNNTKS
ncbi:putative transmembrane protein [Gregarina niphandrodes]|uniref:Transmembrane protein n=1 Tax=Gregarina niphandrodes TaxID=110365 RepID=A0A023B2C8_GRENI|nr:putative transmembrane protein [Gregarina niphandrodes]EZG52466.1 putative transmembrane protein [Gregarina niphandrodes]|eukprot:XP_011131891.1 putative transmembrane protein [Gregarina niphandrodes]